MQVNVEIYRNGELIGTDTIDDGIDFSEHLKQYRDDYIEQDITHNGKTAKNTKDNLLWLASLEQRWKAENSKSTIKFKNVDESVSDASIADIQGLQKQMFLREQKGREAEAVVLANHAETPYTDDSWKTDFDTEVSS